MAANLAVALACVVLFGRDVPLPWKTAWLLSVSLAVVARFFPRPLLRKHPDLTVHARRARLVMWQAFDGLLWALLVLATPYPAHGTSPPLLDAIVVGLIAGPLPFLSVLPGAYVVFSVPPGLALAWREYYRNGARDGLTMAAVVMGLQLVALMISHLNFRAMRDRILRDYRLHRLLRRSRRREATVHALLEASPDLIGLLKDNGQWQLANNAALQMFGLVKEELIRVDPHLVLQSIQDPIARDSLHQFTGDPHHAPREEVLLRQLYKAPRVIDLLRCQLPAAAGGGLLLIGRDITLQRRDALARQLRDRLAQASLRAEALDEALSGLLSAIAEHLDLLWLAMLRVDKYDIPLGIAQGGRLRLDAHTATSLVLAPADPPHRVVCPLIHNGIRYGAVAYRPFVPDSFSEDAKDWLTQLAWDIGAACELDAAQGRLRTLAHYDDLTGLPNRALFLGLLRTVLEEPQGSDTLQAVLFIDLDRFKEINDSLGHAAGDRLLLEVTKRLRQTARSVDLIARLSGDEFAMVLRHAERIEDIESILARLLASLRMPVRIGTDQVSTQASIGMTIIPFDDADPQSLLRHADLAMYESKRQGRDRWCLFEPSFDTAARDRRSLQQRLRNALTHDLFTLHYQPQIELSSGRVAGVEALLRWRDPNEQSPSPEVFVPIAEESGLIVRLGEWVLHEACRQQKSWMEQGLTIQVAVNLSPTQFQDPNLHQHICDVLQANGTSMRHISLEITERAAFANPVHARNTLDAWQQLGLQFAIDDFGTGQASLSYLTELPAALIKIDRVFIAPLPEHTQHCTIVSGVIQMAHRLGRRVLAEGVETQAQQDWLMAHGCDLAQGFIVAHPMEPKAFMDWLHRWLSDHNLDLQDGVFVASPHRAPLEHHGRGAKRTAE